MQIINTYRLFRGSWLEMSYKYSELTAYPTPPRITESNPIVPRTPECQVKPDR